MRRRQPPERRARAHGRGDGEARRGPHGAAASPTPPHRGSLRGRPPRPQLQLSPPQQQQQLLSPPAALLLAILSFLPIFLPLRPKVGGGFRQEAVARAPAWICPMPTGTTVVYGCNPASQRAGRRLLR